MVDGDTHPLIARAAPPQALLSFRYRVGIFRKSLEATLGGLRDIVAAGMNPAAKATLGWDFLKATRSNAGWLERHSRGRDEPGRQSNAS